MRMLQCRVKRMNIRRSIHTYIRRRCPEKRRLWWFAPFRQQSKKDIANGVSRKHGANTKAGTNRASTGDIDVCVGEVVEETRDLRNARRGEQEKVEIGESESITA